MPLAVTVAADSYEVLWALGAFPLISSVVDIETDTSAAVLAESAGAFERDLSALLPAVGAQVRPIVALPLLPGFAVAGA